MPLNTSLLSMPLTLLACGSNAASHLALNHAADVSTLTPTVFHPSLPPFPDSAKIIDLVSASSHSLLLLDSGLPGESNLLLGAGTNTYGQLGPRCALWDQVRPEGRWKLVDLLGSLDLNRAEWQPVRVAVTWTTSFVVYQKVNSPSANQEESQSGSAIMPAPEDGDEPEQILVSCGSNDFGELGVSAPATLDAPSPIPISQPSQKPTIVNLGLRQGEKISLLKGGQRHVIAVIDGPSGQRVVGWGAARKGELDGGSIGLGVQTNSGRAMSAGSSTASSAKGKGKGKGKAATYPSILPPTIIDLPTPSGQPVVNIALGASHTLALLPNGDVLAWGSNAKGQLSGLTGTEGATGIAATWGGSYLLSSTGTLSSQGSNTHSQLLRGSECAITGGEVGIPEGWDIERIVAGSEHLLVLARRGDEEGLWAGGWNEHGNLALGDQEDRDRLQRIDLKGRIRALWAGCATSWVWVDGQA